MWYSASPNYHHIIHCSPGWHWLWNGFRPVVYVYRVDGKARHRDKARNSYANQPAWPAATSKACTQTYPAVLHFYSHIMDACCLVHNETVMHWMRLEMGAVGTDGMVMDSEELVWLKRWGVCCGQSWGLKECVAYVLCNWEDSGSIMGDNTPRGGLLNIHLDGHLLCQFLLKWGV